MIGHLFLLLIIASLVSPLLANSQTPDPFKDKTTIQNPLGLRDPFKRMITGKRKKQIKTIGNSSFKDGTFTNIPTIDTTSLDRIRIVGIMLGKERRALAKIASGQEGQGQLSKETFILKEGMTLGQDGAILKAIFPGGIVVVEKIKNVYDQDEYLESILPLQIQ